MLFTIMELFNILLNVLEQFAIKVTIVDLNIGTIVNFINKLFYTNDDFIRLGLSNKIIISIELEDIVKNKINGLNKQICNDVKYFKLTFDNKNLFNEKYNVS